MRFGSDPLKTRTLTAQVEKSSLSILKPALSTKIPMARSSQADLNKTSVVKVVVEWREGGEFNPYPETPEKDCQFRDSH